MANKTKQIVILDAEERMVLLDAGTIEVCEKAVIVRLTLDCARDNYSLKYNGKPKDGKKSIVSARIRDGELLYLTNEYIKNELESE